MILNLLLIWLSKYTRTIIVFVRHLKLINLEYVHYVGLNFQPIHSDMMFALAAPATSTHFDFSPVYASRISTTHTHDGRLHNYKITL